ncbi:LssY C-terminal domain-containing protein [Edaphobacter dinghuensis]|nr:LssY C-terminal domain-containing protein [Edaphobacter dinghuensis]
MRNSAAAAVRTTALLLALFGVMPISAKAADTTSPVTAITIVRKDGHKDGVATMTVSGSKAKLRSITRHAMQAWPVRDGQGALILVVEKKHYLLRYYDLDSGRRRNLGAVPFDYASLQETKLAGEGWAFALSGTDPATGQPLTLVGSTDAMPGVLPGEASPMFTGDTLTCSTPEGRKTIKVASLLGTNLDDIYTPPQTSAASPEYLQVFPNGTAMTVNHDGTVHKGRWHTDGTTLHIISGSINLSIPQSSIEKVTGVPAGTKFSVRLLQPLSSRVEKEGMIVHAVSIEPLVVDGSIFLPEGSAIDGTVTHANGVGWGFKHETAALTIVWNRATTPDGHTLAIDARTFEVENAQEKVNANGRVQGIRSTGTAGNSAENGVLTFAGIDPIAYIFASAAGSAVLGFAEPEILYNGGTELILEYVKPVITTQTYPFSVLPSATTTAQREHLQALVKTLPFRTRTKAGNKVSDLTNLVFIGSPEALHRAFAAAGWLPSDELNAGSTFRTLKTLSGNHTYTQAPMSVLLLDERAPIYTLSKTTNTFASRHHLRVFPTTAEWDDQTVLTASSTQDIGIAFSRKQKTFIHVIDEHIDNERSKIVNDLKFTGCVTSLDMVPRPWVPTDAYNSTGDRLLTDGQVAVVHLSSCDNPRTTPEVVPPPPNRFQRSTRNTALTIRNSLYRGNLIYQGISGSFKVRDYLRSSSELPEDYGAWRKTDASGTQYQEAGAGPRLLQRTFRPHDRLATPDVPYQPAVNHKWDPPRYELALEGGYLHFRETDLSFVDTLLVSADPADPYFELDLYDQVNDGWTAGGTVTVNSWKYFSNEFSYFRQQGKYTLGIGVYVGDPNHPDDDEDSAFDSARVGLTTRQFEYNLLAHMRPPTSRWRPYVAVGPTFQLISLSDSPLKKPAGPFKLGLSNLGLIKAAFDFGRTAPLDGGGTFQFGLQYGGGIKYRISPRVMMRADYRETWSRNPDIIRNSYENFDIDFNDGNYTSDVFVVKPTAKFFQDRFTLGVAFTF